MKKQTGRTARLMIVFAVFVFGSMLSCVTVQAASFDIQPIRINFDAKTRVEKLLIRNLNDSEFPLQIKAYRWIQNDKGEDLYEETQDIVIFPKMLTIRKGEEKLIRIGTNVGPGATERTYRIFAEEIPTRDQVSDGANIRLYMKIGVPVFLKPSQSEEKASIESVTMRNGRAEIRVGNKGNQHIMLTGIAVNGEDGTGKESFSRVIGGWYLLSGTSKVYETIVPQDVCKNTARLNIEARTNGKLVIRDGLAVEKLMCVQTAAGNHYGQ